MTVETIRRLQELARSDPAVAPLARLQAVALQSAQKSRDDGLPSFARDRLVEGLPLLHGETLTVDLARLRSVLVRLAETAERESEGTARAALQRALASRSLDPLMLLTATIAQDGARLAALADEAGVEAGLLATLAGLAVLPLLLACGQRAAPIVERASWQEGYCPVCAAWPALAEVRGLERRRWLRCARCGSGWPVSHEGCSFCGETDWRRTGYLSPAGDTESRRAVICESCRGYLKTLASLTPIAPAEVAVSDVTTLELDMAALERGYARPALPALPLDVRVAAKRRGLLGRR